MGTLCVEYREKHRLRNNKIGYADIVSGYKYLFETRDSNYYKGLGVHTDYLNIFSAMSDVIYNGKDIVNIPEKTVLLKQILSI